MATQMYEAGAVGVRLGGIYDDNAFRRWDRAVEQSERKARSDKIEAALGGDYNARAFEEYERALREARSRSERRKAFRAQLGGDYNPAAFRAYERALRSAEKETEEATERIHGRISAGFGGGRIRTALVGGFSAAKTGVAAAGLAVGAAFMGALNRAMETEAAGDKLAGQLGLTERQSARAGRIAGQLYKENYGESLEGVNDALRSVGQNIEAVTKASDRELRRFTANTLNLTATFGTEADEITRTVGALVRNGLARDASEAFDLITAGFQRGADKGGEFLDTLNEYAEPIKSLGLDAEGFTNMLVQGGEQGVYSVDKIGDALKEFSILATDGSERTAEAFKAIGLDADGTAQAFARGGPAARRAMGEVLEALRSVRDPLARDQAGVALYGSMWEDIGGKAILGLDPARDALGRTEGAATRLGDTLAGNASSNIESFKRRALMGLTEFVGGRVLPTLGKLGPAATRAFEDVKRSDIVRSIAGNLGGLARTVIDFGRKAGRTLKEAFEGDDLKAFGRGIGNVARIVSGFYAFVIDKVAPGLSQAFTGLVQVVRGVVRIIGGLLTLDFGRVWQGVKDLFGGALRTIVGMVVAITGPMRGAFAKLGGWISDALDGPIDFVRGLIRGLLDTFLGLVTGMMKGLETMAEAASKLPIIGGKFKGLARTIRDARGDIDEFRESLRRQDEQAKRTEGIRRQRDAVESLRRRLGSLRRGSDAYRETLERLRRAQRRLNDMLGATSPAARRAQRAFLQTAVNAAGFGAVVVDVMEKTGRNVNEVLASFGARAVRYIIERPRAAGRAIGTFVGGAANLLGFEGGGFLGRRGQRGQDDRLVLAADGEAFLNHHQIPIVDAAMHAAFGAGLDDLFSATAHTRHAFASGGRVGRRIVTASEYGNGDGDAMGASLFGWAELSNPPSSLNFSALGNLPRGYKIAVTHGGRRVVGPKVDVGAGGPGLAGKIRAVDMTQAMARALGFSGLANVLITDADDDFSGDGVKPLRIGGPAGALRTALQAIANRAASAGNSYIDSKRPTTVSGGVGGMLPPGAPASLRAAMALAQSLGLTITSTTGGTHTSGSYHYLGRAFDTAGPASAMAAYYQAAKARWGRSLTEHFYDPLGGIKHGAEIGPIGGHSDHVHTAFQRGGRVLRNAFQRFAGGGRVGGRSGSRAARRSAAIRRFNAAVGNPLSAATGADAPRMAGLRNIGRVEQRIEHLQEEYPRAQRRFDLSEEVWIIEGDEDTPPRINLRALRKHTAEQKRLLRIRVEILRRTRKLLRLVERTLHLYREARARVEAAIEAIIARLESLRGRRGKQARFSRRVAETQLRKLRDGLGPIDERIGPLRTKAMDLPWDVEDARMDVLEDRKAIRALNPRAQLADVMDGWSAPLPETDEADDDFGSGPGDDPPVTPDDPGVGGDGSGPDDPEPTEPAPAPPSPEEIARAASEQLASFNSSRQDLFSSFGSNFEQRSGLGGLFGDDGRRAAGVRNFGAFGSDFADRPGSGFMFQQTNNFAAPPPDPHTWAHNTRFEIEGAVG